MQFFDWNLRFVLPLHILRAFLANGVLFSNEFEEQRQHLKTPQAMNKLKNEWSRSITTEALSISDLIASKGNISYRSEQSSDIAAAIVYLSRKNILEADSPTGSCQVPQIWPQELVMITRCTEKRAKRILVDILRPMDSSNQPAKTQKTSTDQLSANHHQISKIFSLSKLDALPQQKYNNSILTPSTQNLLQQPQ